jgi:hypothetical protein
MRRFLILATVLGGGLLTACDGDGTGPGGIFGTYTLVSVNGEELPVEVGGTEYIAGWIRLNSDSTFTASLTIDLGSGPVTDSDSGTFAVDGSTIDFFGEIGFSATVSGNTLTIREGVDTFVFRK